MVGSKFGADPSKIMGFVTSGGTESLMCAIRSYRNYGMQEKGHGPGEGVIIAPDTVHAAVIKAAQTYLLKVILIPTDINGNVNLKLLKYKAKIHSTKLVAIIGSAPSYRTGCVDPIEELAPIAIKYSAGLHVDCCLGGFIINYLDEYNTDYLAIRGVTSLSADTHKNGQAPKGSSVLVTKHIGSKPLATYSIYAVPDWSGGVYGTPKDAGSQACTHSLNALLSMLIMGDNGYENIAKTIQTKTSELSQIIESLEDFMILNQSHINIVAFRMNSTKISYKKGTIYALAHEMNKLDIVLNTMKDDTVHFCITARFAADPTNTEKFKSALCIALDKVKKMNTNNEIFSGDAGIYCSLESAMDPSKSTTSMSFIENLFWGEIGAYDAVKQHFLALLHPYKTI